MTDDVKQKSIEEMIKKHTAKMGLIKGNSQYKFDMLDFVIYLASVESKAKSPPVIMPKTFKEVTLGTVYGPCKDKESGKARYPNDDYTVFTEE